MAAIRTDACAQRIPEFGIPNPCLVLPPQIVDLLAVSQREWEVGYVAFEVVRLVTDDVAIRKNQVKFLAIVKTSDRRHQRGLRIEIAEGMPRAWTDAIIAEYIV